MKHPIFKEVKKKRTPIFPNTFFRFIQKGVRVLNEVDKMGVSLFCFFIYITTSAFYVV